jgi:hypothetical protein
MNSNQKALTVKKHNSIVSGRFKGYGLTQIKLFNVAVASINESTKVGEPLRFLASDVLELLGLGATNHAELRKATREMFTGVEIIHPDGVIEQVSVFDSIKYSTGGEIEMTFHRKVLPLLVEAKKNFTLYYFQNVQRLKSVYSIRIYELCKQYENTDRKYREFEILELKQILNIQKKYPRYANFKDRAINVAIKEINEKTDLIVDLVEIKKGRSVVRVGFNIQSKESGEILNQEVNPPKMEIKKIELNEAGKELVKRFLISEKVAKELQDLAGGEDCLKFSIIQFVGRLNDVIRNSGEPRNLARYAEKSLRDLIPTVRESGVIEKERKEKEANEKSKNEELRNEYNTDKKAFFSKSIIQKNIAEWWTSNETLKAIRCENNEKSESYLIAKEASKELLGVELEMMTYRQVWAILKDEPQAIKRHFNVDAKFTAVEKRLKIGTLKAVLRRLMSDSFYISFEEWMKGIKPLT